MKLSKKQLLLILCIFLSISFGYQAYTSFKVIENNINSLNEPFSFSCEGITLNNKPTNSSNGGSGGSIVLNAGNSIDTRGATISADGGDANSDVTVELTQCNKDTKENKVVNISFSFITSLVVTFFSISSTINILMSKLLEKR